MDLNRRSMLGAGTAALILPFSARGAPFADHDTLAATVDAYVSGIVGPGDPGMAIGVWSAGRTVLLRGYGLADLESGRPITPSTPFHVASMSKQFAAMAVGLLAEEGKVDIAADIRTYLPWTPDFGTPVTVEHIIHHVSGIRDQWTLAMAAGLEIRDVLTQGRMKNLIAAQRSLNFQPGTDYAYCNTGYTLLGEIVAAVTGKSLPAFTIERIFAPLGMANTHFVENAGDVIPGRAQSYMRVPTARARWRKALLNYETWGASSLSTTVPDMLAWQAELLHPRMLPPALVARAAQPYRLKDGRLVRYGYAMVSTEMFGRPLVFHGGGDAGFKSWGGRFAAADTAVVVLRNDAVDPTEMAATVVDIYLPPLAKPVTRSRPIAATDPRAAGMIGTWYAQGAPLMTIAATPAGLASSTAGVLQADSFVVYEDGTADTGRFRNSFWVIGRDKAGTPISLTTTDPYSGVASPPLRRATPDTPSVEALTELTGSYRSAELDTTCTLSVENGALVSRSLRVSDAIQWRPSVKDVFDSIGPVWRGGSFMVERAANGRPTAILFNFGRIRALRFDRVA